MKKILIVEDSPEIRQLLHDAFVASGWETDITQSGHTGLDLLNQKQYDILLTDLKMPEMDGLEYIKSVSELENHPPIIIYSSFPYDYAKKDALSHGASLFVSKDDTSIKDLVSMIDDLLSHQQS